MAASEILSNLYLGGITDAEGFEGERLCVLEEVKNYRQSDWAGAKWIPVHKDGVVSREKIAEAGRFITERLDAGARLLVHCGAGMERSPLTVACWLVSSGKQPDLDAAYAFLKERRPMVADRRKWLEPEHG